MFDCCICISLFMLPEGYCCIGSCIIWPYEYCCIGVCIIWPEEICWMGIWIICPEEYCCIGIAKLATFIWFTPKNMTFLAGSLISEWFTILNKEIFNPNFGLFLKNENNWNSLKFLFYWFKWWIMVGFSTKFKKRYYYLIY